MHYRILARLLRPAAVSVRAVPTRSLASVRRQREKMRAGYARYRGVLEAATGSLFILFGGRLLWRALVR